MVVVIPISLLPGLPFTLILYASMGLPLHVSMLYVAAGIAASAVVLWLAGQGDPLRRLKRYSVLGGGAAVGLLTNGLFTLRFKFSIDAPVLLALLGGVGAVLYAILFVATEPPLEATRDPKNDARFFRRLGRLTYRQDDKQN